MQEYTCHKVVKAAKIVRIRRNEGYLVLENAPGDTKSTPTGIDKGLFWIEKHSAQAGGYLVEYEDGYQSYSPAEAFEKGYTLKEEEWEPMNPVLFRRMRAALTAAGIPVEGVPDVKEEAESAHPSGLKEGDAYWILGFDGEVVETQWDFMPVDYDAYNMGNVYFTKPEAKKARDRQLAKVRVMNEIKKLNILYPPSTGNTFAFILISGDTLTMAQVPTDHVNATHELSGSGKAIGSVIQHMPKDVMLAMGWEDKG